MPAVAAVAVDVAVAVAAAASRFAVAACAAAAAEHSREVPGEYVEAAQTVAVAEGTHTAAAAEGEAHIVAVAAEEGAHIVAAAEEEAHIAVAAAVVNALFALYVRMSPALRLPQWRRKRTLAWRPAGRSCDDAASQ